MIKYPASPRISHRHPSTLFLLKLYPSTSTICWRYAGRILLLSDLAIHITPAIFLYSSIVNALFRSTDETRNRVHWYRDSGHAVSKSVATFSHTPTLFWSLGGVLPRYGYQQELSWKYGQGYGKQ